MPRCGILPVLALLFSTQVVSSLEGELREKRQAQAIRVRVQTDETKATFFEANGERLVQLTSLYPADTSRVSLGETDSATCDLGTQTVTSTSLPEIYENEVTQCSEISIVSGGFVLERFNGSDDIVQFNGTGELYLGPNMVLYVQSAASGVSDFIESQRPSFIPVLPPVDVRIVRRADNLALNLNDMTAGRGMPPPKRLDSLFLFDADCMTIPAGRSISYSGKMLRIRRGLEIFSTEDDVDELHSLQVQNLAGRLCDVVTRDVGSRDDVFSGPGYLCIGSSASEIGETVAFFTNSSDFPTLIQYEVINQQIACDSTSSEGPTIIGRFTPNVNQPLITLNREETTTTFLGGGTISKNAAGVEVRDRFGNVVESFICADGVNLAIFDRNRLRFFDNTQSFGPRTNYPSGTAIFNPGADCMVFIYPTVLLMGISGIISECRETSMITPPPPIRFTTRTTNFGATTLSLDGFPVLETTSSVVNQIGAGQTITYSGNMVRVQQGGSVVNTFGGINAFTANTAFNRQITGMGSIAQSFSGPGTLYRDSQGRGFFTTLSSVMNLISQTMTSTGSRTVDIRPAMVGNMTNLELRLGGETFFTLPSLGEGDSKNFFRGDGISFTNGMVRADRAMNIPASSSLTYFPGAEVLQVGGNNITDVQGYFIGNPSDGDPITAGMRTDSGGGILYRGASSAFYWPSSQVPTNMDTRNFLDGLGVSLVAPMPIANDIETLTFFDGMRVQVFNRSAFNLLPGPGFFGVNGNLAFFTNDIDLVERIPEAYARFFPPSINYNSNTGNIAVVPNGGGMPFIEFPIDSSTIMFPGGLLMYGNGNITSSTGEVIALDINTITVFDGFQTMVVTIADAEGTNFTGGGLLVIKEDGSAFYTTSPSIASEITGTIDEVPAEPPVVDDTFFMGSADPGEIVITARSTDPRTIQPIVSPLVEGYPTIADASLITEIVSIGCKADGRPKPEISWFRSFPGFPREPVDLSDPRNNVTSRRQGQSVLTVDLGNMDTVCFQYICVAENEAGTTEATAQVCPRRFDVESDGNEIRTECSASCGVGDMSVMDALELFFNGTSVLPATPDLIPPGLVKPRVTLCNERICPEVEFMFRVEEIGECSTVCNTGEQRRLVECVMMVDGMVNQTLDDSDCISKGIMKPDEVIPCTKGPCFEFRDNGFGSCDEFNCQVRNVFCAQFDPSDPLEAWPANEMECEAQELQRPTSVRSCNGGICEFGTWIATPSSSAEGGCSEACGQGVVKRDVACVNVTDPDVPAIEEGFCNVVLRPQDEVPCFLRNCPEPPVVDDTFFTGSADPGEIVITARSTDPRTIQPIVSPLVEGYPTIADASLITEIVSIGCKADGRPKPEISWFRSFPGFPREPVDLSDPRNNVTSRRQGQSVLTVDLGNMDTVCFQYICVAENEAGTTEATAQVCPRRFDVESDGNEIRTECSASCGVGDMSVMDALHLFFNGTSVPATPGLIPPGLVKPRVTLCNERICPEVEFMFRVEEIGECSTVCNTGEQRRLVECVMMVDGMVNQTLDDSDCISKGIMKPDEVIPCTKGPCFEFRDNGFGSCDEFNCQVRNVFCAQFDPSDPLEAWPANEMECEAQELQRPTSVRSCNGGICEFGTWIATPSSSAEGGCSEACGQGVVKRDVACVNVTDPDVPAIEEGFCNVVLRPQDEVPCFLRNCPGPCVVEPFICTHLRELELCKDERVAELSEKCCISCPLQASPIPPLN